MANKLIFSAVLLIAVVLSVSPVLAHLHPFLPFECAPENTGAGNEAFPQNGENGQQFIPGLIPLENPGKAEEHKNFFEPNPGVDDATAHCADPQD